MTDWGIPEKELKEIIQAIISSKDSSGNSCLQKFSHSWLLEVLTGDKLAQIEAKFKEYTKNRVDLVDFCKVFLAVLDHSQNDTVFLVLALIDIFKQACQFYSLQQHLQFKDFTNFIVDRFMEGSAEQYKLQSKKIPAVSRDPIKKQRIREIDLEPPVIEGMSEMELKRINPSTLITDSCHHKNGEIKSSVYSKILKRVFTLDSLSDQIKVYDKDCKLIQSIRPKACQFNKDLIIISFTFSEDQQRIGACLKNFTLSFWDARDDFQFEKSINTSLVAPQYQIKIWYVTYLGAWMTGDKTGHLHVWDILMNKVQHSIDINTVEKYLDRKKNIGPTLRAEKRKRKTQSIVSRLQGGTNYVLDLAEISYLKLIATASVDKQICIWDMHDPAKVRILCTLNMDKGGVHTIKYFKSYQVILVAGYENTIPVFSVTPHYHDITVSGRLIGHLSIVTAIVCVEGTPMVISSDDSGCIKTWDVRDFSCFQSIDLNSRTVINNLINLDNIGKVAFVGQRINFLSYDLLKTKISSSTINNTGERNSCDNNRTSEDSSNIYPIKVLPNLSHSGELVICTKRDLRFVSLATGRTSRVLKHLVRKDEHDELTDFHLFQDNFKMVVSDHRGQVQIHSYTSGDALTRFEVDSSAVVMLKVDSVNKMFVSLSQDNTIKLHREVSRTEESLREGQLSTKQGQKQFRSDFGGMNAAQVLKNLKRKEAANFKEKIRSVQKKNKDSYKADHLKNKILLNFDQEGKSKVVRELVKVHGKQEITILEVSVYHNLFLTGGFSNEIYIYDYEYWKILGRVELDPGVYPTTIKFIDGLQVLVVASSDGNMQLLKIDNSEPNNLKIQRIGFSSVNTRSNIRTRNKKKLNRTLQEEIRRSRPYKKKSILDPDTEPEIKVDRNLNPYNLESDSYCCQIHMDITFQKDSLDDEFGVLKEGGLINRQTALNPSQKARISHFTVQKNDKKPKKNSSNSRRKRKGGEQDEDKINHVSSAKVYMGLDNGFISVFDLEPLLKDLPVLTPVYKRQNYNPYRNIRENFELNAGNSKVRVVSLGVQEDSLNIAGMEVNHFYGHKSRINSICTIKVPKTYILTSSTDKLIKIFNTSGDMVCAYNINHPLPLKWDLDYNQIYDMDTKIVFAFKVLQQIYKRYYNVLFSEGKKFDVRKFIEYDSNHGRSKVTSSMRHVPSRNLHPGGGGKDQRRVVGTLFEMTQVKNLQTTNRNGNSNILDPKNKKDKVILMKQEYLPNDFASKSIKKHFKNEQHGALLKQMESKRKTIEAQIEWKKKSAKYRKELNQMDHPVSQKSNFYDEFLNQRLSNPKKKLALNIQKMIERIESVTPSTDLASYPVKPNYDIPSKSRPSPYEKTGYNVERKSIKSQDFAISKNSQKSQAVLEEVNRQQQQQKQQQWRRRKPRNKTGSVVSFKDSQDSLLHSSMLASSSKFKSPALKSIKKKDFYQYASSYSLLDPQNLKNGNHSNLKKMIAIGGSNPRKLTRVQRAQKAINLERKRFNSVVKNLNQNMRASKVQRIRRNNSLSLPQLQERNESVSKQLESERYGDLLGKKKQAYRDLVGCSPMTEITRASELQIRDSAAATATQMKYRSGSGSEFKATTTQSFQSQKLRSKVGDKQFQKKLSFLDYEASLKSSIFEQFNRDIKQLMERQILKENEKYFQKQIIIIFHFLILEEVRD